MELSNGVDCEPIFNFGDEQVGGTHPVHCDSILRDFGNEPCRVHLPRVAPCLTERVIVLGGGLNAPVISVLDGEAHVQMFLQRGTHVLRELS